MLYKFDLDYNTMETKKNICCAKVEGASDHSTISRFKKFCSSFKNLNEPARSVRPKTGFQGHVLIHSDKSSK